MVDVEKQRTILQNKALHKWFRMLAQALNDAGLDMRTVLKDDWFIPWTEDSIKQNMAKPVMDAMYSKDSTAELTTKECSMIVDVINRHMGEKHGVTVPFPDRHGDG